jgi:lysine biosynthesis protein LysW
MKRSRKVNGISCPECEHPLKLGNHPHRGQRIVCPRCKTNLVVVDINPLNLDLAMLVNHSAKLKKKSNVVEAACPECDHLIKLNARSREGEQLLCDACHTRLEVVSTNPLELDVATTVNLKHNH